MVSFILGILWLFVAGSEAMIEQALPNCAKPGLDMGAKSGGALGGIGAAAYTTLMSTCPSMIPHITAAGAAGAMGAAGAASTATAATVSMPGLILGGPLAPVAAMMAAGVLGGAMVGGAAGSLISCREVGMKNDSHLLIQYKEMRHPDGFMVEMSKDGRYRPQRGYNHHVHPMPHMDFDYDYDYVDMVGPDPLPKDTNYDYHVERFIRKGPYFPGYFWRYPMPLPRPTQQTLQDTFLQHDQMTAKDVPPIYYPKMKHEEQDMRYNDSRHSIGGFRPVADALGANPDYSVHANSSSDEDKIHQMMEKAFMFQRQPVMLTPPRGFDTDHISIEDFYMHNNHRAAFDHPARYGYPSYRSIQAFRRPRMSMLKMNRYPPIVPSRAAHHRRFLSSRPMRPLLPPPTSHLPPLTELKNLGHHQLRLGDRRQSRHVQTLHQAWPSAKTRDEEDQDEKLADQISRIRTFLAGSGSRNNEDHMTPSGRRFDSGIKLTVSGPSRYVWREIRTRKRPVADQDDQLGEEDETVEEMADEDDDNDSQEAVAVENHDKDEPGDAIDSSASVLRLAKSSASFKASARDPTQLG